MGHYGSGKSEVAINLAILKQVDYLVDLDIVNPYFRSRERKELLKERGIKVISSSISNSLGSDLPYISKEIFIPIIKRNCRAIYDFGGDDIGSRVVHQFREYIDIEEVDVLVCVNTYRDETANIEKVIKMIKSIEKETSLKVNGLINNSNLLRLTTCNDILNSQDILKNVSNELNIPIVYTAGLQHIMKGCTNLLGDSIFLELYLRQDWL